MSTSAGSRSASRTTLTSSSRAGHVAADHHGRAGIAVLQQQIPHRADLPGAASSTRGCRSPAPGRRCAAAVSRCGDDLPRLEPIGQRDHRVVVAQRGADPAGDGLRGGHRRDHPHPHARPLLGFLQHGGRHREHARIAGRHHRDGAALLGQRAGQPRAGGLVGVVAGVAALTVASPDAVEVGAVADEVGGRGELAAALRGHPVGVAGAQAHHRDAAGGRVPGVRRQAAWPARSTARWSSSTSPAGSTRCFGVLARST